MVREEQVSMSHILLLSCEGVKGRAVANGWPSSKQRSHCHGRGVGVITAALLIGCVMAGLPWRLHTCTGSLLGYLGYLVSRAETACFLESKNDMLFFLVVFLAYARQNWGNCLRVQS